MPTRADGKIGVREYASILLLSVGLRMADSTPSIYFQLGYSAAWVIPLASCLLMGVSFMVMLSLLKKYKDKGLIELTFALTGRFGGTVIGFTLFLLMLLFTVVSARNYTDILNMMVFQLTPLPALLLMLLGASLYVASRGIETIGRTAWIVIPYIEVAVIALIAFVWEEIEWYHLFPIAGPGLHKLLLDSVRYSSFFGEIILFAAFFPLLRSYKSYRLASYIGFGISCIKICVMLTVFVAVYDYPAVKNLEFPFQQLTRSASIGGIVTHIESVFLAFWLISTVIHFAIYLFLLVTLLGQLLHLQPISKLLAPLAGLILLLAMLPTNLTLIRPYWDKVHAFGSIVFLALPFVLWSADRMKRWFKV